MPVVSFSRRLSVLSHILQHIICKFAHPTATGSPISYFLQILNKSAVIMTELNNNAPHVTADLQEIQDLQRGLEAGTKSRSKETGKKGFSCKRTTFTVSGSPTNLSVDSWRFQDWDYKRNDLPTYARGLFLSKNEKGQPEIATRGYDKFFNINEMPNTHWGKIEKNTKGPYELSLKENGCIIFISGLHDGTLLVCSKHSTGLRDDIDISHAAAGEEWVNRQLKAIGKSRQDLALELRNRNATAVAELCDDAFEEHILTYGKEDAGLYLHGINLNVPQFTTYPGDQVQEFATKWGFKKTEYLIIDEVNEVKRFLENVAETGTYNDREIEGFVIRCKTRFDRSDPYVDWFFKYKFEEPYLMYRQWRECTKALISGKYPRYRKHAKITEEYLFYARKRLAESSKMAKEYQQNHGIIQLRNDFLKEMNLKGTDIIRQEYAEIGGAPEDTTKNIILFPIATIGCGKTTLAVSLQHLFGWGHVQNDNIQGKNRPPRFTNQALELLSKHPVVIADRNNAQKHERKQFFDDVHRLHGEVRIVALNFTHTPDTIDSIRRVTQGRVLNRGDNHQTIQAASEQKKVLGIMEGFINRYEPLDLSTDPDRQFDNSIDLDPTNDSRENLEIIVGQLSTFYPKVFNEMPTSQDMDDAISHALGEYRPALKHSLDRKDPKQKKDFAQGHLQSNWRKPQTLSVRQKRPLEYISVTLPRNMILDALENSFGSVSSNKSRFFRELQKKNRVQEEFHVTLLHRASSKTHPKLWQKYSEMHAEINDSEEKLGGCKIMLERIVWDNRTLAIVVRIVDEGWECANEVAHITIGTRSKDIKPKESNDMLQKWLAQGSGDESHIGEIAVQDRQIVDGIVKAVLSR